jgi:hypothetical protein
MQIAGNRCKVCQEKIILSREGKACVQCGTVVHLECESRNQCDACGQRYQNYELPSADPLSEAIIPSALRPAKGGGPTFAIILASIILFLVVVLWCVNEYIQAHSHGK